MNKTMVELFAGVGGFRLGMDRLHSEWETVWFSQWEPGARTQWAHECYVRHFGDVQDLSGETTTGWDVSRVDKNNVPDHTLLVGGFPCLTGDTQIMTEHGNTSLVAIQVGDKVLSHDGQFHRVLNFYNQGLKDTYIITGDNISDIRATGNHKFLVKTNDTEADWVSVDEMLKSGLSYFTAYPFDGNYKWSAITSIEPTNLKEQVYDIEVEETHSFVANGAITHNCQDYSVAHSLATSKGIEGKKGVLWWQIRDIIIAKQPPFVLLENVDRLIKSPAKQRGRDFGVILACFNELRYSVEWRVVNAALYGGPQRRRRTFIFAYRNDTNYGQERSRDAADKIVNFTGLMSQAFPLAEQIERFDMIELDSDIVNVSDNFVFNFESAGFMRNGVIYTAKATEKEEKPIFLRDILEPCNNEDYYIKSTDMASWVTMKGAKKKERTTAEGHTYTFSEGAIPFLDRYDRPGRTMLTSEGTKNRSTHIVADPGTGAIRILTPIECERLQGFDDNWTEGMPDRMRRFCMGNALVVPMITRMGKVITEIVEKED